MFFDRQVVQFGRKLLPPRLGSLKMEAAVYCKMSVLYLSVKDDNFHITNIYRLEKLKYLW